MIVFRNLVYKNFLSCGNVPITISLDKSPNTLFIGKNGAGKSTFLDAITFVLFGKAFRDINKPTVVNSVNDRECLVEIEFDVNGKSYKVSRGIKPNVFEIYKEGVLITKDSSLAEYQNYLESKILKMNFKSFTQIVILGSTSFTPFMKLRASDRREIIEDLLDIQVFSVMNTLAKQKLQTIRDKLDKISHTQKMEETSIFRLKEMITSMTKTSKTSVADIQSEIHENLEKIKGLEIRVESSHELDKEKAVLSSKIEGFHEKKHEITTLKGQIESTLKSLSKKVSFFENNDVCPTCNQDIENHFKCDQIKKGSSRLDKGRINASEIESTLASINQKIREHQEKLDSVIRSLSSISAIKKEIGAIRSHNQILEDRLKDLKNIEKTITTTQEKLKDSQENYDMLELDKEQLLKDREYYDQIVYMLKDGGIKTKIIKKYIPLINQSINSYLTKMNLFVHFTLDENFDEEIKSRYRTEFKYGNFSEGEKFRIDLSILFAWRQIASMRNSVNCNLLIMDEIFDSSLDSDGTDDFIKIMLNDLAKGTNLFVISHKQDVLRDKFHNTIKFEKVKGFSVMRMED